VSAECQDARRAFAVATVRLTALFAVVFYGTDVLAALRPVRWHVHAAWELEIPYWPAAYLVYLSVFAVPFLPLLMVRSAQQVRRWERRMSAAVVGAGVVFVVFPAQLGYAPTGAGDWQSLATLTRAISGRYNLLPSLHVALSVVTLYAVWPWAGTARRTWLAGWFVLLVASVLLTHQHHVADIAAGALLGAALGRAGRLPGAPGPRA
jgi:hypothetical protein